METGEALWLFGFVLFGVAFVISQLVLLSSGFRTRLGISHKQCLSILIVTLAAFILSAGIQSESEEGWLTAGMKETIHLVPGIAFWVGIMIICRMFFKAKRLKRQAVAIRRGWFLALVFLSPLSTLFILGRPGFFAQQRTWTALGILLPVILAVLLWESRSTRKS